MKASLFFALGFLASFTTPCSTSTSSFSTVETVTGTVSGSIPVPTATSTAPPVAQATVKSKILVIAREAGDAKQITNGLNGYGIPFEVLLVPQAGVTLPTLSTSSGGNYGGIVALSGLAYNYGSGGGEDWRSAITDTQWNALYTYQTSYGVRMVQIDVYPQSAFGTNAIGSCCGSGVEQLISFSNTSAFTQAGLNTGAGMSTLGLYHYVTQITDPATTWEIARFAANSQFSSPSTAAVINKFGAREQMAFFISWATDWSPTSNFLQHAYITWMTRGLYAGYRRVNLNAQIDDMMLTTPIYNSPTSAKYRLVAQDMTDIKNWVPTVNAKMNPGSIFRPEIGYNGNGNVIEVDPDNSDSDCDPGPIYTGYDPTDPEWEKPLGTGETQWPLTPTSYSYNLACLRKDPLSVWFQTPANQANFFHMSHTYTHMHLNNATYDDVKKEIGFNQQWFAQTGISSATFSPKALIPPAITGLHNGDALQAMYDLGLRNSVGDNARPALRNQQNPMWPYISNIASDGFNGFTIIPRWPLRIYWNCDTPSCTTQEWVDTSGGSGGFTNLMLQEKNDMMRYFFGLYRDGVMFHQINLRTQGMPTTTTADGTVVRSLYQAWVEQTVQEFKRLCKWPMISLKQDDLADQFTARMARDQCSYALTWIVDNHKITGVTVTANGNTCSAEIPVTVPGSVVNSFGFRTEKVGNDPLTVWVKLTGSAVTLTLTNALTL